MEATDGDGKGEEAWEDSPPAGATGSATESPCGGGADATGSATEIPCGGAAGSSTEGLAKLTGVAAGAPKSREFAFAHNFSSRAASLASSDWSWVLSMSSSRAAMKVLGCDFLAG